MASRWKLSLAALGLAAFTWPVSWPALAESPRAVVELFTSQGCSSCPPADALLVDLAKEPDIVALSFPVDYWDYLGWKDTLAQHAFTARQKAYAHARSDRQVFTPQIIVNGRRSCVGSDRAKIEQAMRAGAGTELSVPVGLREENGTVRVSVGEAEGAEGRKAEVWLLSVMRSQTVPIVRGENEGKTITYANVVRSLKRLGEWRGEAARFDIPAREARGDGDGYVVLLQTRKQGDPAAILGAAKSAGL